MLTAQTVGTMTSAASAQMKRFERIWAEQCISDHGHVDTPRVQPQIW